MIESNIDFTFPENVRSCKFDDTHYYRKKFNSFYNSKGVDFLAETNDKIYFIEIKNCIGYESENVWRTKKNNVIYCQDKPTEESFDIEVTKKFSSTQTSEGILSSDGTVQCATFKSTEKKPVTFRDLAKAREKRTLTEEQIAKLRASLQKNIKERKI